MGDIKHYLILPRKFGLPFQSITRFKVHWFVSPMRLVCGIESKPSPLQLRDDLLSNVPSFFSFFFFFERESQYREIKEDEKLKRWRYEKWFPTSNPGRILWGVAQFLHRNIGRRYPSDHFCATILNREAEARVFMISTLPSHESNHGCRSRFVLCGRWGSFSAWNSLDFHR